ncbi:MAG: DUF4331 domain-containing protein [Gemmatimonadota bacterium]|nr:DUF4331 domain-containing protein [Gemmatimonadota bacterium]
MSRYRTSWMAFALGAALLGGACSDKDQTVAGPQPGDASAVVMPGTQYFQIDFLGNPLVSEVTIVKRLHSEYNISMPYRSAYFSALTQDFIVNFAGRTPAYAATVASLLYPDMLLVFPDRDPATAGWLSWALANGYGGRTLTDDVVDVGLSAIFSSLLDPTNASCAPFELPLCTDNVDAPDKAPMAVFPYLAPPTTL